MRVLRDKSGVSLIFVLAIMMLLISIGVSALAAAGLNYGTHIARREKARLDLYVGSMERTVKASLEVLAGNAGTLAGIDITDDEILISSLGSRIFSGAYAHYIDNGNEAAVDELTWNITADSPDVDDSSVRFEIDIFAHKNHGSPYYAQSVDVPSNYRGFNVSIKKAWTYVPGADPALSVWTPQELIVSGYITVALKTFYGDELKSETKTVYRFEGGEIEEIYGGTLPDGDEDIEPLSAHIAANTANSTWTVISYENIPVN